MSRFLLISVCALIFSFITACNEERRGRYGVIEAESEASYRGGGRVATTVFENGTVVEKAYSRSGEIIGTTTTRNGRLIEQEGETVATFRREQDKKRLRSSIDEERAYLKRLKADHAERTKTSNWLLGKAVDGLIAAGKLARAHDGSIPTSSELREGERQKIARTERRLAELTEEYEERFPNSPLAKSKPSQEEIDRKRVLDTMNRTKTLRSTRPPTIYRPPPRPTIPSPSTMSH